MTNKNIANQIKNENFKSLICANLVSETFENKTKGTLNKKEESELEKSNKRMKEVLEQKIEHLELKVNGFSNMNYKKSIELDTQKQMVYKLFETIDHKLLKLDYLDSKSQNLELEDIAYFIKVLDHEIMDFENMIQEKVSIKEILKHIDRYPS